MHPSSAEINEAPGTFTSWRYRALVWSILLAIAGYLGFAVWGGWSGVASAIGKVGWFGIALALVLSLANYLLRFIRWQVYLRALNQRVSWRPSLQIYLAGFALTTTPGKAGEAVRSVLLKRRGTPYAISLAALLSERLSDLLAVMLLALIGLSTYPAAKTLCAFTGALLAIAFVTLSSRKVLTGMLQRVRGHSRVASLTRQLLEVLLQARRCHTLPLIASTTVLSVVAWAAEAWAFHVILQKIGYDFSISFSTFVYAISMLAGALSFMPGGLGGTEAVMAALLSWGGASASDAAAATLLIRLTTLWFAVGIGAVAFSQSRFHRGTRDHSAHGVSNAGAADGAP